MIRLKTTLRLFRSVDLLVMVGVTVGRRSNRAGWMERRAQRQALSRLDDHLLRDIGKSRAEARAEFEKPFWKA